MRNEKLNENEKLSLYGHSNSDVPENKRKK